MAKKYEIDIFDVEQIKDFQNELLELDKMIQSKSFMQFLGNKCLKELNNIIDRSSISSEYIPQMAEYKSNNKKEVEKDYVRIYND